MNNVIDAEITQKVEFDTQTQTVKNTIIMYCGFFIIYKSKINDNNSKKGQKGYKSKYYLGASYIFGNTVILI